MTEILLSGPFVMSKGEHQVAIPGSRPGKRTNAGQRGGFPPVIGRAEALQYPRIQLDAQRSL